MLTRLGANSGDLIVEGSLAVNRAYCEVLAALRPEQRVFTGDDSAGTARGAALLAQWPLRNLELSRSEPIEAPAIPGLAAYRTAWDSALGTPREL
jgi:hypothetical protein